MKLSRTTADIHVPSGIDRGEALARTTVLGIGAHQDDLEIMAAEGILDCYGRDDRWFTGVVVTDGAGSPRDGVYRDLTDPEMRAVRREEQKTAARLGGYSAVIQLDHPSAAVKSAAISEPLDDLTAVLKATRPEAVYTHSLADKHDTHVAVALRVVSALRRLEPDRLPSRVLGCEVWRDLDWLVDADKVVLDVSGHENLQAALLGLFDSQISGGKRYDLATLGRRRANATYASSHTTDATTALVYAMDLVPLVRDPDRDVVGYVEEHIARFAADVKERLARLR